MKHSNYPPASRPHTEYRCEACDFRTENYSNARTHNRQTDQPSFRRMEVLSSV